MLKLHIWDGGEDLIELNKVATSKRKSSMSAQAVMCVGVHTMLLSTDKTQSILPWQTFLGTGRFSSILTN